MSNTGTITELFRLESELSAKDVKILHDFYASLQTQLADCERERDELANSFEITYYEGNPILSVPDISRLIAILSTLEKNNGD